MADAKASHEGSPQPGWHEAAAALFAGLVVIDGDKVRQDVVTYRLHGYDAPETSFAKCAAERAGCS
jgi:hypothetical protein